MYLNHRVKKTDFLKLVNFNRLQRNLKPIKSSTTVFNRARPANRKSHQAKRHLGLGLFCSKKPPKAESNENELTHHQRAHKRNIIIHKCSIEKEGDEFTSVISSDDKAYVCPQTSTRMQGARKLQIFRPTDSETARVLPRYDFPESMINCTPGAHRIMEKTVKKIDDKEEILFTEDDTVVFTRPKYYVGNTDSVWASELLRLRYEEPILFVAKKLSKSTSNDYKKILILLNDKIHHYLDSSEKEDVMKRTDNMSNCKHREHELCRLKSLGLTLTYACDLFELQEQAFCPQEIEILKECFNRVSSVYNLIVCLKNSLENEPDKTSIWECIQHLMSQMKELLCLIKNQLPVFALSSLLMVDQVLV